MNMDNAEYHRVLSKINHIVCGLWTSIRDLRPLYRKHLNFKDQEMILNVRIGSIKDEVWKLWNYVEDEGRKIEEKVIRERIRDEIKRSKKKSHSDSYSGSSEEE
jgi:hypothetical protein